MQLGLTKEQLADRRNGIGGSDAAKIVNGQWHDLWLEKSGRSEPEDLSRVLAVQMGLFTEPLNLFWFERETGHKVFGRGEVYRHPDYDFIRCTLDGVVLLDDGKPAIVQAKHVSAFQKIEEIEQRYYPQVSHEMLVTGASVAYLSVFLGTQKWECVEVARDRDYTARLLEYEREFWQYVERDEPPPDRDGIVAPVKPEMFRTVDLSASNLWCSMAIEWRETLPHAKRNEKAAKELRGLIEPDVGEAFGGGVTAVRNKAGAILLRASK